MTKKKLQIKTIIDRRIVELFPSAIYRARLNRSFTKEELDFIQKTKTKCYKNVGNKISLDKNILDHAPFTALKKEMLKCIDDYFTNVIDPVKPIKPYSVVDKLYRARGISSMAQPYQLLYFWRYLY